MRDKTVDILIVGAGFAGLGAADSIALYNQLAVQDPTKNLKPLSFAIVEAACRPGGRTKTVVDDPQLGAVGYLDVGGEYLGMSQSYMTSLVDRLKIPIFPTPIPAKKTSVYQAKGDTQLTYFTGNYPMTFNIVRGLQVLDMLTQATKATLAEPWNALLAPMLDNMTVEAWGYQQFGNDTYATDLMQLAIRCAFSVEWSELSMLYLLFYGATAGSFEAFENVTGDDGGDRIRLTFGTASLVDALLASFKKAPAYQGTFFNRRVVRIDQSDGVPATVTIETTAGEVETWKANQVIVAMSPKPSLRIEYQPDLPAARRGLAESMRMGRTIKGFLLYEKPWWRAQYTGYVLSAQGPACWMMDNTWQDPETGALGQPALMTFIAGSFVDPSQSKDERQAQLVKQVAEIFQDEAALTPQGYVESDWQNDPFAGGCPAAVPGIGALVAFQSAIRDPFMAIHWAGSESGLEWTGGYMNGAVQSGVRAAGEAINALLSSAAAGQAAVDPQRNAAQ